MPRRKNVGKSGHAGQKGLTLVELLIALVLTAIIGGALYQGLINQTRSFVQQDQAAEAQQNCRVATDNILRELRMAGYSMAYQDASNNTVSDKGIVLGTSVTTINGTTVQTNNASSRNYTDALVIRRGDSVPWTVKKYKYKYKDKDGVEKTKVSYEERVTVRLGDPDYILLMNVDKKEYRTAKVNEQGMDDEYANMKKIRVLNYTGSIASTNGLTDNYEGGSCVKLKEIAFYVDTSGSFPKLMKAVNGGASQVVANHIEDLQVAYQTSNGNWFYNVGGTGDPTINDIRNVRVSVVARSRVAGKAIFYEAALEDGRRHPTSGSDGYPRRVMTSQIRARNFGVD